MKVLKYNGDVYLKASWKLFKNKKESLVIIFFLKRGVLMMNSYLTRNLRAGKFFGYYITPDLFDAEGEEMVGLPLSSMT